MANIENAEFKTIDGVILKGLIYPASRRGPGVILTPGVSPQNYYAHSIPRETDQRPVQCGQRNDEPARCGGGVPTSGNHSPHL